MKAYKNKCIAALLPLLFLLLGGCSHIGEKSQSITMVYGIMAACSFLLLIAYCFFVRKKEIWFLLLFVSVLVVNIGYVSLAASKTLEEALLANRIAYLGSVFLPLSMLMTILNVTDFRYKKWLPIVLAALSVVVFLVAASPGYLDIYYKEVSLEIVNGVAVLHKVYGPWHVLNLCYLLFHFTAMIAAIAYAAAKKRLRSFLHALILALAVLVNIGIWLLEQIVKLDFEFLSVSYIISELFLLGLYLIVQEEQAHAGAAEQAQYDVPLLQPQEEQDAASAVQTEEDAAENLQRRIRRFGESLAFLTQTERAVYDLYLAGKSTKEILTELNIKENTLKYHNKNIYSKLEVSSRKQLLELARQMHALK
ncbi:MAG: hypothetical protein E7330_00625 [Clostridiales bacterium]|nr:hypothetical protein [Clostridiales bacterium]